MLRVTLRRQPPHCPKGGKSHCIVIVIAPHTVRQQPLKLKPQLYDNKLVVSSSCKVHKRQGHVSKFVNQRTRYREATSRISTISSRVDYVFHVPPQCSNHYKISSLVCSFEFCFVSSVVDLQVWPRGFFLSEMTLTLYNASDETLIRG
ncbi:hypothetical protein T10_12668 [Trichinella papuae]|uniref:Uncharacterized protein n=1 Tax=Trichinella papuae TaxID=268474 RepID=A0A0V1MQX9_9BILA|nr:hypothetical protein T10_12668 [Trichinella papuae]